MSCSQVFATVGDYIEVWRLPDTNLNDQDVVGEIELALSMAHGNVYMALAAADACECALPDYAVEHLKKLVILDAASLFTVSCGPSLSETLRTTYLELIAEQLELIRTLEIDPCGDSGANQPAVASAEQSMPNINIDQIIRNGILRNNDG